MSESERPEFPDLKDFALKPSWVSDLEKNGTKRRESHGGIDFDDSAGAPRFARERRDGRRPERFGDRDSRDRDSRDRNRRRERDPGPSPGDLLDRIDFHLRPTPRSVETLGEEIRRTARAYPIFELAKFVLAAPERFEIHLAVREDAAGVTLYRCPFDGSVFLSKEEAAGHIAASEAFKALYRPLRVEVGFPKGHFPVVALCGLSGAVLGPPNYHAYAEKVEALHRERFNRMPFEDYRAQIRMSREEEDIRKWTESESWTTHFEYDESGERLVFRSAKDALRHLLDNRPSGFLEACRETVVPGAITPESISKPLMYALQHATHDTRRHPLPFVRALSDSLEATGLKFFKQDRRITFVTATRPKPLKAATELSDRVASIVDYIRRNRDATTAMMITTLAGSEPGSQNRSLTPQEIDLFRDLRWLVREGHVIEFSNGTLQLVGDREKRPPAPSNAQPAQSVAQSASAEEPETSAIESGSANPGGTAEAGISQQAALSGGDSGPAGEAAAEPAVDCGSVDPCSSPVSIET